MEISETVSDPIERLRVFETRVRQGVRWVAQTAWQSAGPVKQRLYACYGLHPKIYTRLSDLRERMEELAFEDAFLILESILPTGIEEGVWSRNMSNHILAHASFALCMLGEPATSGDLDFFARCVENAYDWEGDPSEPYSPKHMVALYRKGAVAPLRSFLEDLFKRSVNDVNRLLKKRKVRFQELTMFLSSSEGKFVPDEDYLFTEYDVLKSLLDFVHPAGHA